MIATLNLTNPLAKFDIDNFTASIVGLIGLTLCAYFAVLIVPMLCAFLFPIICVVCSIVCSVLCMVLYLSAVLVLTVTALCLVGAVLWYVFPYVTG